MKYSEERKKPPLPKSREKKPPPAAITKPVGFSDDEEDAKGEKYTFYDCLNKKS